MVLLHCFSETSDIPTLVNDFLFFRFLSSLLLNERMVTEIETYMEKAREVWSSCDCKMLADWKCRVYVLLRGAHLCSVRWNASLH